jgi:DNA-binding NtrC family response regulator
MVLIVEGEPGTLADIADYLRMCGFRTLEASNATLAQDIICSNRVDLMFSDVVLGEGMDGLELAAWVSGRHPSTKIILTSSHFARATPSLALPEQWIFIAKPYRYDVIERMILQLRDAEDPRSATGLPATSADLLNVSASCASPAAPTS